MKPEVEVITANELLRRYEAKQATLARDPRWGNWRWQKSNNVLLYRRKSDAFDVYEIDLDKATSCAGLLDWVFQVYRKRWMSPKDIKDLLDAFTHILDPQANMCSFGKDVAAKRAS